MEVTIRDYVITGKTGKIENGRWIFLLGSQHNFSEEVIIKDGIIDNPYYPEDPPRGVIAKYDLGRILKHKKLCHFVILNGDIDGLAQDLINELSEFEFPTVSFTCLAQLVFGKKYKINKSEEKIAKMLVDGTLELVDYVPDTSLDLTKKERQLVDANYRDSSKPLPKKKGFTIIGGRWHRSCTAVFVYSTENDDIKYFLVGQDEGSYFGVEYNEFETIRSVEEGFYAFIPDEISGIKGLLRQGEWFLVPASEKDVKSAEKYKVIEIQDQICLPREHSDSNRHWVFGREGFVANDKLYVLDPVVEHNEHSTVAAKGWYWFIKNTAVRSVSVQGVD